MKCLLKLFLSIILFPVLTFSAELEEAPFEKAAARNDSLESLQQSCLIFLIDGTRYCTHGYMKRAYHKMSAFYNQCVIGNNYTLDSHKEIRAIANKCWLDQSSHKEYSLIHSLILHYFPEDLH